jgi:hypothetical protein
MSDHSSENVAAIMTHLFCGDNPTLGTAWVDTSLHHLVVSLGSPTVLPRCKMHDIMYGHFHTKTQMKHMLG